MKFTTVTYILFLGLLVAAGCRRECMTDPKAYQAFLNNPDHGLTKEKTIAGVKFKLRYLPADLITYNLVKGMEQNESLKDSIRDLYSNSLTFLLNIGPADHEKFDITRLNISDYRDFADRIETMAFQTQEYISLDCGDSIYKPVITRMETINAPENSRNFIVVFQSQKGGDEDLRKHDMRFVYRDEMFETGINKFTFLASDIDALPEFKF